MSDVYVNAYKSIYRVLNASTAFKAKVAIATNVFPLNDPGTPAAGAVVVYGWPSQQWDAKRGRGVGTLTVMISSEKNKIEAGDIAQIVRGLLRAKSLTDMLVTWHRIAEQASPGDGLTSPSGRFEVELTYAVNLIATA